MKRVTTCILAIFLLLGLTMAAVVTGCGGVPDDAVATVGDVNVTKAAFNELMGQVKTQYESYGYSFPKKSSATWKGYAASIVSYLIEYEILEQSASDEGVSVTDKDVESQITQIEQSYGGEKKVLKILKQQGMTMKMLKDSLKYRLLSQKMSAAVVKDVSVTDAQMEAYWEKHSDDYQKKASRTVRHVLTKTKAKALAARAALLEGDSWTVVAKKYSTDTGTSSKGGSLGAIHRGEMVTSFENAAFSLSRDVISQPVKSQYGWHIIEVTKITPAKTVTYEQAKKKIRSKLLKQAKNTTWSSWLEETSDELSVQYAAGYDPDELTATASPSPGRRRRRTRLRR